MIGNYRVVDLRLPDEDPTREKLIDANTPELAALLALGLDLARSGSPKDMVARVYWSSNEGLTTKVRLYTRVED